MYSENINNHTIRVVIPSSSENYSVSDWKNLENEINNLPDSEEDMDVKMSTLPKFIYSMFHDPCINRDAKIIFMKKFVLHYLHSEKIRDIVDGWNFIFVNGDYVGIFKNEGDAFAYGRNKFPDTCISLYPMYPKVYRG